jgi:bifunctional non-homologous end joining protein LigD
MNKIPFLVAPMLATLVDEPFAKDHWVFEEKYDGVRMLAYKEGAKVSLVSRNGIDRTARYASIAAEIGKLRTTTLLLDGEMVVFDARKVSHFQLLQQGKGEARYAVFDCLYKDGRDLRRKPLSERREALKAAVKSGPLVQTASRLSTDGIAAFATARKRGLEGGDRQGFESTLQRSAVAGMAQSEDQSGRGICDWRFYRARRQPPALWSTVTRKLSQS